MKQARLFDVEKSMIHADITKHAIFFVKDPASLVIEGVPEDTLLVYHAEYTPPKVSGATTIPFEEFKAKYVDYHVNMIILVGLNRMINPSNRCDFIHEYLSTLTANIPKLSIDTEPFIGEPWRLFFHYLFTSNNLFKRPHSFAVQTEWLHWFNRESNECIISPEYLGKCIVKTFSDLDLLESTFTFTEVDEKQQTWYAEAKQFTFNKYNTLKLIVNALLKHANTRFGLDLDFGSYHASKDFTIPDIGVYRFVVEENMRRMQIYNTAVLAGMARNP